MSVHWSKKRVSELQNCVETCHELLSCRDTTIELLFQGAEVLDAAAPGCVVVVGRLTAARDGAAFSGCSVVFEDWYARCVAARALVPTAGFAWAERAAPDAPRLPERSRSPPGGGRSRSPGSRGPGVTVAPVGALEVAAAPPVLEPDVAASQVSFSSHGG